MAVGSQVSTLYAPPVANKYAFAYVGMIAGLELLLHMQKQCIIRQDNISGHVNRGGVVRDQQASGNPQRSISSQHPQSTLTAR